MAANIKREVLKAEYIEILWGEVDASRRGGINLT